MTCKSKYKLSLKPITVFSFRSLIAQLREEYLLEELEDIAAEVNQNGWKLEGLEVS